MTDHVAHALRLMSTLACGVVLIAFVLWASDEGRAVSDNQVALVQASGHAPSVPGPAAPDPDAKHGGVRGAIDEVNDSLIAPFEGAGSSEGPWMRHAMPALLALLAYGLLARLLINYIPQRT